MATVWRAHDTRLDRDVAVKVLDLSASAEPTALERFRREAVATAGLTHPNVVSVFDAGIEDQRAYLVMSLVDGRSVAEMLREQGPLPLATTVSIGSQVAAALQAAHATGLVHRDIKPANVMVGAGGHVTVLDFGIAQLTTADATLTAPASVIGSAAYMSPEQASGARVGPASDLYSLGCLVMAMLTGQPPYPGDNAVSVVAMQVNGTPPALADRVTVPQQLDDLVSSLLDKDPDRRPDATATLAALRQVAQQPDLATVGPAPAATALLPSPQPTRLAPVVGPSQTSVMPASAALAPAPEQPHSPTVQAPAGSPPPAAQPSAPAGYSPPAASDKPPPPSRPRRKRRVGPVIAAVLVLALAGLAFAVGSGRIGPLAALRPGSGSTPAPATTSARPAPTPSASRTPTRASSSPVRTPTRTPSSSVSPSARLTLQLAVQTVRGLLVNLPDSSSKKELLGSWDRETPQILAGKNVDHRVRSFSSQVEEAVGEGDITVSQGLTIMTALEGVRAAAD